jgi:hypothetical protein
MAHGLLTLESGLTCSWQSIVMSTHFSSVHRNVAIHRILCHERAAHEVLESPLLSLFCQHILIKHRAVHGIHNSALFAPYCFLSHLMLLLHVGADSSSPPSFLEPMARINSRTFCNRSPISCPVHCSEGDSQLASACAWLARMNASAGGRPAPAAFSALLRALCHKHNGSISDVDGRGLRMGRCGSSHLELRFAGVQTCAWYTAAQLMILVGYVCCRCCGWRDRRRGRTAGDEQLVAR